MVGDFFGRTPLVGPYVPPPKLEVDVAEFIALKVLVMVMATRMANSFEAASGEPAQAWINSAASWATETIQTSVFHELSEERANRLKEKSISSLIHMLGGIKFPPIEGTN